MVRESTGESRQDWLVVFTSTLALAVSVTHIYSTGLFIVPIETEFGWTRAQITAGLAVVSVISVVLAPFVGMLVDRIGSRRIALPGMILYCTALALFSTTTHSIWHWWAMWGLLAFGSVLIKPTVWMAAIAKRFVERRGLAFALALCGTGIGTATMPLLTEQLVQSGGWRFAYVVLGAGCAAIALPMIVLFFKDQPKLAEANDAPPKVLPGLTIREGLLSRQFICMAFASLLVTLAIIGLTVHFVPIMISHGLASQNAAAAATAIGITSIVGRIGTGVLLDRFNGCLVGAIGFGLPIVACVALLNFDGGIFVGIVVGGIIGFSLGAEIDVVAYLAARYFGLRNYGMLFGSIAGLLSLGAGIGPTFAGMMFDKFGSYDQLVWSLMPIFAVGALLIASLGSYPDFEGKEPAQ